jgi:hypothetical protein
VLLLQELLDEGGGQEGLGDRGRVQQVQYRSGAPDVLVGAGAPGEIRAPYAVQQARRTGDGVRVLNTSRAAQPRSTGPAPAPVPAYRVFSV